MPTQKFHFAELYKNNIAAVTENLRTMWCGVARSDSQEEYHHQLQQIIPTLFAGEDAMPLVQCVNSYEPARDENAARMIAGDLWAKGIIPYEHQYQSWHTLLEEKSPSGLPMSICVTTGTGSGKTECFMVPLIKDLCDNHEPDTTHAIFLYPLNALMEDQKERLNELIEKSGSDLSFAVYNGDMPEREPSQDDPDYDRLMRKIDSVRGIERDDAGNIIEYKYKHIIATRDELRKHPANILLTNPTMLEYILLRSKDASIINPEKHSLRWVAIDETHTYAGAGAAELAMLLRRVLMAFDVTKETIRFATSSATIGDDKDPKGEADLIDFISKITGLEKEQVRVIRGKRMGLNTLPQGPNAKYWQRIINENTGHNRQGFIALDKLFDYPGTIQEKLEHLDRMCEEVEKEGLTDLRVKLHYFYHVPNQGLFVDLNQHKDGAFCIFTHDNRKEESSGPLLELSRCKACGEYVAIAEVVDEEDGIYQPLSRETGDMFDLQEPEQAQNTPYIFGLMNNSPVRGSGNISLLVNGNKIQNMTRSNTPAAGVWRLVANVQCCCPNCGIKLTKAALGSEDEMQQDEPDSKKLFKMRVSNEFISRVIAPSTLDQMTETQHPGGKLLLHKGQQYISFVDSRQAAAKASIKQNIEEERKWVYMSIFFELCRLAKEGLSVNDAIKIMDRQSVDANLPSAKRRAALDSLDILRGTDEHAIQAEIAKMPYIPHLTWEDMTSLLDRDPISDKFCQQFAERTEQSKELDANGHFLPETKRKYIQAILVDYLAKRPRTAMSAETMGLFCSYYEKINDISIEGKKAIDDFNSKIANSDFRITPEEWQNLLYIFMDYIVRSNESVYLKMPNSTLDIYDCVRFATQKERRRTINKPSIKEGSSNTSRIIRLLAVLIAKDRGIEVSDAIKSERDCIQSVIDQMWSDLCSSGILTVGEYYDQDIKDWKKDEPKIVDDEVLPAYRLNLYDYGVTLYNNVYLCEIFNSKDECKLSYLRPVSRIFKGYSPYLKGAEPMAIPDTDSFRDKWEVYPYYKEAPISLEALRQWAEAHRSLIWKNGIWGKDGDFANRLNEIYRHEELFIQAEHTAQVDKMFSRQLQKDFKEHGINILACSTTMEMGVDLGSLELVLLTSVPPHPSNYKQRAGRSGRRGQIRSACVTLCGSDAIGLRTLNDPMENLICKKVINPIVDLQSPQVIQRHVNAFLIREFGVFDMGAQAGTISQKVINYYSNYVLRKENGTYQIDDPKNQNITISPANGLKDSAGTPYEIFNQKCTQKLEQQTRNKLLVLLENTAFHGRPEEVVQEARRMNEACYAALKERVADLAESYGDPNASDKQKNFFKMKFMEPLVTQLLTYWSTHRFTPNANMPVNIIEFDINESNRKIFTSATASNPSYTLRTALSQYVPGNAVAIDGMVRIVRGLRYTNFFKKDIAYKHLYRSETQVVIDDKDRITDELIKWSTNDSTSLELLEPTVFLPDANESVSRIIDANVYTRVNAQLIDASPWEDTPVEPHLYSLRNNYSCGVNASFANKKRNARILYYNEGVGFGYCHCSKCGRTVMETFVAANAIDPDELPSQMNPLVSKSNPYEKYHEQLSSYGGKHVRCVGCRNSNDSLRRNVVIGGTITTDFTEIRIRHSGRDWITRRYDNESMLITLAILFTQALAEELSIDRGDLDFAITPNGHICVFDTNPGGSGYANQLARIELFKDVLKSANNMICKAESIGKDVLIDRYTLAYANRIDISAAKDWIEEEFAHGSQLPNASIQSSGITTTTLMQLQRDFAASQTKSYLFVNNDYDLWEYDNRLNGWRTMQLAYFVNRGSNMAFCVMDSHNGYTPESIRAIIRSLNAWAMPTIRMENPLAQFNFYPIAYIDGCLYFTADRNMAALNGNWGQGQLYSLRLPLDLSNASVFDCHYLQNSKNIWFLQNDDIHISTSGLGELIHHSEAADIINLFIKYCQTQTDALQVYYQDEHLKSVMGMLLTLQTIDYFVKLIDKPLSLEYRLEEYEDDSPKSGVAANMESSGVRDRKLQEMSIEWAGLYKMDTDKDADICKIVSAPKRSLTHWRELTFECGKMRLSIFPDGGLCNGWSLDKDALKANNSKYYSQENTSYTDTLPITLREDIKIEVSLEDS